MLRSDLKRQPGVKSKIRTPSIKPLESVVDISSPCSASNESSYFKENINVNTSETSKLNVEPLQMKRKKKGGEHNLRKSLAWDRAFFTEEGVLDPQELSIISGVSYKEGSSVINNGTPCSSQLTIRPADRQKSKYNLSKEFQDADLVKDRRKSILSSKLYSSSSNIMNSNKVSTWVGSQSRTRSSGCPVPLPPSSLKRPANVNTTRTAAKEVKLPKIPGLSTGGPSPVRTTSENNTPKVNCMNHNQVVQPAFSIQRNAGLRSLSKSLKTPHSASKVNSVQSAHQLERNSSDSSFKGLSSVKMSAVMAENSDVNSVPKIVIGNITPTRPANSSEEQCKTITPAALFAQNSHESGRRLPPSQDQSMKPTGLRMPSPSLSYFSQPKASVLQNLSMRDSDMDICGSQKSRDLKLQETLRRTPQKECNMPISISSSTMGISTRSCSLQPFHVNDSSHKLDLDSNSTEMVGQKVLYDALAFDPISCKLDEDCIADGQVQDLSNKIGQEVAEIQKADHEMPSQSGNYEQTIDDRKLKTTVSPIKINAIDEPCKQLDKCNFDFIHGSVTRTQCENVIERRDHETLARQEQTCELDCREPCRSYTDQSKYVPGATDKITHIDKNVSDAKGRTTELLEESQQLGTWCSGSGNLETLLHVGSKHQHGHLPKETKLTEKLHVAEARVQDASTIGGYRNSTILISDAGDNKKLSGKKSEVQTVCLEVEQEPEKNPGLVGLLSQKYLCPLNSLQENFSETLSLVLNTKDGNKLGGCKVESPRVPTEEHRCNIDKDKLNGPLINRDYNSVANSLLRENNFICMTSNHDGSLTGKASSDTFANETIMSGSALDGRWQYENDSISHEGKTVLLDNPANKGLSINVYQETLKLEIDHRNSFLKSRTCEVSQKNVLRNVTDAVPVVEDNSGKNSGTSTMLVKGGGFDMDNQRSEADSRIVLAKSPRLNACFVKQSECLELPNAGIEAQFFCQSNDGLKFGNISQRKNTVLKESSDENEFGSMVDSFTVHEKCVDFPRKSSGAGQELSMKHESCSTAKESDVATYIADVGPAVADASRTKPFPDPNESEICQETSTSFNGPFPKLDNDLVKDSLTPNNIHGNGLNEKSRTLLLPQNAVPFSDEWLSAIEAAGEDILTRKGGAVQNSPTDKSVPEPSPWSPVKRKNNVIGPFDCTKCTNIQPSE